FISSAASHRFPNSNLRFRQFSRPPGMQGSRCARSTDLPHLLTSAAYRNDFLLHWGFRSSGFPTWYGAVAGVAALQRWAMQLLQWQRALRTVSLFIARLPAGPFVEEPVWPPIR